MSVINPRLQQWLQQQCALPVDALYEIPGDASFRRYFRLQSGAQSYLVMDASKQRDCFEPYVAISQALLALGLSVPHIIAQDQEQGWMVISDFGDILYLHALQEQNADALYKTAMDALAQLQTCRTVPHWPLPAFDQHFMQRELSEFNHWFLTGYLNQSCSVQTRQSLQAVFTLLSTAANQQTQVFIHRDYHSANLMVLADKQVGILDFQDACIGPVTYDLVSLLRDCYIDWPDAQVQRWVAYYYEQLRDAEQLQQVSLAQFQQWFDWMGLQRHMKALFIFARKYLRDQTSRYLKFMPRTLRYVVEISGRYPELRAFHTYARDLTLPVFAEERVSCEG